MFGDVTHHLRAALDNLVGALAVVGPTRYSTFPIATDDVKFRQLAATMLRDVPEWGIELIRELQPIPGGPREDLGHVIRAIDAIGQRDRHRALLLHAPVLDQSEIVNYPDPTALVPPRIAVERRDATTTVVRYPTGSLIHIGYRARVLLAEDVEGLRDDDIMRLANRSHAAMLEVVSLADEAVDQEWRGASP